MSVRHADEVEARQVVAGRDTTIQVLISAQEGPNFALRRFRMLKGGGMPPPHQHGGARAVRVARPRPDRHRRGDL